MSVEIINFPTIASMAAIITTIGGAWLTLRRIARDSERNRKMQAAEILQDAKEADLAIKIKLESQIHELDSELKALKETASKDLAHLKEYHSSELRNLGERIENLRDELRQQTTNILALLTKLIEKD